MQKLFFFLSVIFFLIGNGLFAQTADDERNVIPSDSLTALCVNSLGDYIWHDSNVDGIQDEDELGINGVIVELLDSAMNFLDSTISDESGNYLFSNVASGTYTVKIAESNFENEGVLSDSESQKWYLSPKENGEENSLFKTVVLGEEEILTIDFGFFYSCMVFRKYGPDTVSAGDIITYDFRIDNCGDVVLHGGVSVYDSLINPEYDHLIRNGVVQPRTVWEFSATYISSQDDCGNLVNNAWAIGHPLMPDGSKLPTITDEDSWNVEVICDDKSTLGDRVWDDVNKNGIQDLGENGIANIAILLYHAGNTLIDTTHTDNDGFYLFEELIPGDYYIEFIQPEGYLFTRKNQGDNKEIDSDADEITGKTDLISLTSGGIIDFSWDAGFYSADQEEFDLMLEMTVSNSTPKDNEDIYYTLTVTNISPLDAKNAEVTDMLPTGLKYSHTQPANYDTSNSIWYVGDIASGNSEDLDIHVKVDYKNLSLSPSIDLGIASDYNLFVLKDIVQPSSDTEGKAAIGRDATFSNYSVGYKLPASGGTEDVLIVGRKLTFTSGAVFGGNVVYGKYIDIPQYAVSVVDGTIRQEDPVPIDFEKATAKLIAISAQLANREANGTIETQWGGLTLTGTDPMFNVFEINGEQLSNANNMTITVPTEATVILNITGDDISWSGGLSVNGTDISNVLYNFTEATNVTISGIDVRGSILAPTAYINFIAGVINGQMICQYFEGRGQMNNTKFRGFVPGNPEITNCAEITYSEPTDTNRSNNSACVTIYANAVPDPNNGEGDEKWEEVSGFEINEMIWSMYQSSNGMMLGTVGGKIYLNADSGWELLNEEMTVGFIWSLFENEGIVYAGTDHGLFKYYNSNWELTELSGDVRSIISLNGILYSTVWGKGVFFSNDNGETWTAINDGLIYYSTQTLTTIGEDLFVGTFGTGVLKYDFANNSWVELPIDYKFIWTLASDEEGNIYAGTSGNGVYVSSNNGESWTQVNAGLPNHHIYLISAFEENVYAATWFGGIYKLVGVSGSAGSWQSIGLSGVQVSSISVDKSSGTLFAGTSSGSIYKMIDNTVSVKNVEQTPTEYEISQNYPNPFNPSTTIKYSIPVEDANFESTKNIIVSLKVYNILGQVVATLVNKEQRPGYYEVNWNASDIPSGIYFYRITAGKFIRTNKMILMK